MTIGERIKQIRKNKMQMSQSEFAVAIGVSQGTLSDIEKNKGNPSVDTVISASRYSGISTDWILVGNESALQLTPDSDLQKLIEAYDRLDKDKRHILIANAAFLLSCDPIDILGQVIDKTRAPAATPAPEFVKEESSVYLPILGTAAAGMPIMTEELLEGFLPVPATKIKKNTYLIKARGDSMIEAGINNNDLVIISPQPTVDNGEIALVKVDGDVTIKKFYRHDYGIKLKPANSSMKDIVVSDLAKIRILGKVIGVISAEEAKQNMRYEFDGPNE